MRKEEQKRACPRAMRWCRKTEVADIVRLGRRCCSLGASGSAFYRKQEPNAAMTESEVWEQEKERKKRPKVVFHSEQEPFAFMHEREDWTQYNLSSV